MRTAAILELKPTGPVCTREEAQELLEFLHAEYQRLPFNEQMQVRMALQDSAPPIRSSAREKAPVIPIRSM